MQYASIYFVAPRARIAKRSSVQAHPVKLQELAEAYAADIAKDIGCDAEDVTIAVVMDDDKKATHYAGPWTYYRRVALIRAGVKGIDANKQSLQH